MVFGLCYAFNTNFMYKALKTILPIKKEALGLGVVFLVAFVGLFIVVDAVLAFRIVAVAYFALLFPGVLLSYLFFEKGKIDAIERLVLGVVLSLVLIPLPLFMLSRIGVKVDLLVMLISLLGTYAIIFILLWLKNKDQSQEEK